MNYLINLLEPITISIGKSHLIILFILILNYIIELKTPLKLFIWHFRWKKNPRNAEISLNGSSGIYFIITLIVFINDIYKGKIDFHILPIVIWLIIMIILVIIFRKIYNKYQGIDPNKKDDDYS